MSDPAGSSSSTPKAIGSLAKKPSDVTRQGTHKLKFIPTLPQRRKKEEVKTEPVTSSLPVSSERGRGRGRGDGAGRGRGRGAPPVVAMTASGPFAMGPSLAGSSAGRRSTPRSNFIPMAPSTSSSSTGTALSNNGPSQLKKDASKAPGAVKNEEDEEQYSDPEDGVEIIDMDQVRQMDWMAPETLAKERTKKAVKKEESSDGPVNSMQAVDLDESEEEEELEDIIEDFTTQSNTSNEEGITEDRLFFFRFPAPFPTFSRKASTVVEAPTESAGTSSKKVAFAPDVKMGPTAEAPSSTPPTPPKPEHLDGAIGRLEVYRSGAIKMRLGNNMLFDVNAVTQPSFLQQAVHRDPAEHKLVVLGEVNKQFVVSPNVDALLRALETEDNSSQIFDGSEDLLKMDET